MQSRPTLSALFAAFAFAAISSGPAQAEKKPAVTATISEAEAMKAVDGDSTFVVKLLLNNNTGKDLTILSQFNSPVDFFDLVVTSSDGKIVAQQSYSYHQSPRAKPREFVLKTGENVFSMYFPISNFGRVGDRLNVQLVGLLPGPDIAVSSKKRDVLVKREPR